MSSSLVAFFLSLVPAATQAAPQEDLDALEDELVEAFVELADFCQKVRLYAQRDNLYGTVLELDEDHALARKMLGYRRDADGVWTRKREPDAKDRGSEEDLVELGRQKVALADEFALRLDPLLEGVTPDRREAIVAPYFLLDGENDDLNLLLGRVRDESGRWRSVAELERERQLAKLDRAVSGALEKVPALEPWSVEPPLDAVGIAWTTGFRTDRVRVAGTGSEFELRRITEVAHAVEDFMQALVPGTVYDEGPWRMEDVPMFRRFKVYSLAGRADLEKLMRGFPELTGDQIELLPKLYTSFLDQENSIGAWADAEIDRLDGLTRQLIGGYLRDYFGISTKNGWVWEGLGIYMTELMIGTRRTFYVQPSEYIGGTDPRFDARLFDPESDWLFELTALARGNHPPKLVFAIGKDVNAMSTQDLIMSYALATWIIQEHPEAFPPLLTRIGLEGVADPVALEQAFGCTLPTLEARLMAWVEKVAR